jgi:hypothetical protein
VLYLRNRVGAAVLSYQVLSVHTVPAAEVVHYLGRSTDYRLTFITDAGGRFSDARLVIVAVSGTKGTELRAPPHISAGPRVPGLLNTTLLEFLAWVAAAAMVVAMLRRRHTPTVVVAAATPLVVAALVELFLWSDLLWSPLA